MKRIFALACLAALIGCAVAQAAQPDDLMDRLRVKYEKVDSLRADFRRNSSYISGGGAEGHQVRATGVITWQRPFNLRLSEQTPRAQEVVCDGRTLWFVQAERRRVTIYEVSSNTEALRGLLAALGGLAELGESFKRVEPAADEMGPEGIETVALEPLTPRADMGRLVVWFDADTLDLRALRIASMVGNVNQYVFRELVFNPPLADGEFRYQPPEDFKVFDQRPVQQRVLGGQHSEPTVENP